MSKTRISEHNFNTAQVFGPIDLLLFLFLFPFLTYCHVFLFSVTNNNGFWIR
jgi:hypothetical protein